MKHRHWCGFLIVTLLGLALYLPLLSRHYDLNGITEAETVEGGIASELFSPNHMLFRPAGYLWWRALVSVGHPGERSLVALQVLSAIFGAMALGFMFLALARVTPHRYIAAGVTALLGTSWAHWVNSTDVSYVTFAAAAVAASVAVLLHARSDRAYLACGAFAAVAILVWQGDIFLLPGLVAGVCLLDTAGGNWAERVRKIGLIGGACAAITAVSYLIVGLFVYQITDVPSFVRWASSYSGTALPMYGNWEAGDLAAAVAGVFQSILAVEFVEILDFRARLGFVTRPVWIAPVGLLLLMFGLLAGAFYGQSPKSPRFRMALWAMISYAMYLPFILWWDEAEVKWLIVPNLFLAFVAAATVSRFATHRYTAAVFLSGVLVFALMNFRSTVFPRRFQPSGTFELAECVADNMAPGDLLVASEWNWAGYVPYFYDRQVVSLLAAIPAAGGVDSGLETVRRSVAERERAGGRAYVIDPGAYEPIHLRWVYEQVGLTAADLDSFKGEAAFECGVSRFHTIRPDSALAP